MFFVFFKKSSCLVTGGGAFMALGPRSGKNPRSRQLLEDLPGASQGARRQDWQELPSCTVLTPPPGETSGTSPRENPFSTQQHWFQPQTIWRSISPLKNKKGKENLFCCPSRGRPIADIHSAHMLRLRQFCKVPVYLLSGRCPQNIMHHTYQSFALFCLSLFFSFCVRVLLSQNNQKRRRRFLPSMILSSFAADDLRSAFLQREVPQALDFSMVQNGMLWLEHAPSTLLRDSSTKRLVGRRRLAVFLLFSWSHSPSLRCLAGAGPALDVPLHVKGQVVGPGETPAGVERRGSQRVNCWRGVHVSEECFLMGSVQQV